MLLRKVWSFTIAGNGRACCCAGIYIRQLERKPNRITAVEVKHKSPIELRKLELKLNREQKDEDIFGSQHSSKPHVIRMQLGIFALSAGLAGYYMV